MKNFKKILVIWCIIFLNSCSLSTEDLLDGNWAVDTLVYKGNDVFDEVVTVNMMSISKNGNLTLPKIDKGLKTNRERLGSWKYLEETSRIFIDSKSNYLNGYFDLCFKKDLENNYIKLVLKSETLYLEAAKVLSEIPLTTNLPVSCDEENSNSIL